MADSFAVYVVPELKKAMAPVIRKAMQQGVFLLEADLVTQIAEALMGATAKTAQSLVSFGELLQAGVEGMPAKLESANLELVKGAQEATIEAYEAAREVSDAQSPPYRVNPRRAQNKRYAGGMLEAAIG